MNRRRAFSIVMGASLLMAGLSACGQKGPLYLPEEVLEELERKKKEQQQPSEQSGRRRDPRRPVLTA